MGFDKATDLEADDTGKIFNFEDLDEQDEETEITFTEDDDVTFTVDTTHQGEIVIAMDTDEIEAVEDAYPSANLDFYNFNGATFRKTGTLLLPGEEGQFVYEYKNGALQASSSRPRPSASTSSLTSSSPSALPSLPLMRLLPPPLSLPTPPPVLLSNH